MERNKIDNLSGNFCSFPICQQLQKIGFQEDTFLVYDTKGYLQEVEKMDELQLEKIPAILYQQVINWFRNNYQIEISVYLSSSYSYGITIENSQVIYPTSNLFVEPDVSDDYYFTLNKAIQEALKFIL